MPLRFLIVDDNTAHLKLTANVVLFLGGRSVSASNGAQAIELVLNDEFDVILLDLWMPKMGGVVAATRMLREMGNRPQRPRIVAMTGDVSRERHALCRAVGMDGFLTKPCDLDHLRSRLSEVVTAGHCWPEGPAQPLLDVERLWNAALVTGGLPLNEFDEKSKRVRDQLQGLLNAGREGIESAIAIKDFALRFGFIRLARTMTGLLRALHDGEERAFDDQIREELKDFDLVKIAAHESLHDMSSTDMMVA
jgi:CheY-like chemotaxis protein